ncbi:MAG: extracellular solute-binding protein [Planctomycetota bacterium]
MNRLALVLLAWLLLAAPATPQTVLRVLTHEHWFKGFPFLEETARQFEREHPGVRVEVLSTASASGAGDKVMMSLAGGLPLDVTWIDISEFPAFLENGTLLDLQPFFDADPTWDPLEYFPEILEAMRDGDGHLYGLASTFTPYVMYVNHTLLESAGIAPPKEGWTWADLERICRQVTADLDGDGRTDRYGISITQWLQALAPWIWQNGGRFLDEEGKCGLDEEPAIEAIEFLVRLLHEEKVASNDATFEAQLETGLFQQGKVAFYGPTGYWETYRFQAIKEFEWDVLPLPVGKQAATTVAMRFYVVPRHTEHPQLAYEFVRALAGPIMQRGLASIGNGVPGLISAAHSEAFLKPDVLPESEQVFLDVMHGARFLPISRNWLEVEKQIKAVLEETLLLGRIGAREACERAAALANETFARDADVRSRPHVGTAPFRWLLLLPAALGCLAALLLILRRRSRLKNREERAAWCFLMPWILGVLFLTAGPALISALLSLSEWSPLQDLGDSRWMGLDQYSRLASDATFRDSLRVTLYYALLAVPAQLLLSLGLALLLKGSFRGVGLFRTLFYLPTIISPIVLGAMWRWLLATEGGPVNGALAAVGMHGPDWLRDPAFVVPSFVLMSLWTVGAQMLVFLAGLQGIDPALHEAARLDGAGRFRRLWHVTLPGLAPLILFNLVVGLIQAFQLFAQPFVMTRGGPGNESRFLALYIYQQGFQFFRMGYASTLAWVLFAVVLALTLGVLRVSRGRVHYAGAGR